MDTEVRGQRKVPSVPPSSGTESQQHDQRLLQANRGDCFYQKSELKDKTKTGKCNENVK